MAQSQTEGDTSSDSLVESNLTLATHRREQESKLVRDRRRKFVQRSIDEAYRYLHLGQVDDAAALLAALVDRLGLFQTDLGDLSDSVPDGHGFHHYQLSLFVSLIQRTDCPPGQLLEAVARESPGVRTSLVAGEQILESLVAIASLAGYLPTHLQDTQPVLGYQTQLGERYVRADSRATGTLNLRDTDDELKSILCAGGKGSGKSTAVETLALDSWLNGHKLVDLVDFFKAENALYDIPQQDNGEGLIEAREEMGLPTGFDDVEAGMAWLFDDEEPDEDYYISPELEVLIPLCPGLERMKIPALNGDNYTVRPFTIPASALTYRQLVMLLHHTTEARENELRSAHQALRDSGRDWTLADLADHVRFSGNANEGVTDSIETSLKTAQEKSFVRDTKCPHALDWDEVMKDQQTITAFTVHPMQETADHLVVLSYLIDSLFEARKNLITSQRLSSYPPLTVVMREMHEVAPRSTSESSAESSIENYMIDSLSDMFALTRHANMEVLGDTQKFKRQLHPDVSGLFDQILAFQGHIPDVKEIFRTRVDNTSPAEWVAQYDQPGRCAFISEKGYRLPIQIAPPRSHHLEAKTDGSGLGFRATVDATGERSVDSPWSADIPRRLQFHKVSKNPMDRFFEDHVMLVDDRKEYVTMEDLHQAYTEWAESEGEDQFEQARVSQRLTTFFDEIGENTSYYPLIDGRQRPAHRKLVLTW